MKFKWYFHWLKYIFYRKICKTSDELCGAYVKRRFLNAEESNREIGEMIQSGRPFMACRIGAGEAFAMRTFYFHHEKNMDKCLRQICTCAGFFPEEREAGFRFVDIMEKALTEADLCGTLFAPFDDYFIGRNLDKAAKVMELSSVEPYMSKEPWSQYLKGKRVLVVHPFAETISKQYEKREALFENPKMLPDFELKVYKAVQTSAGEVDERFVDWFEALAFMAGEISEIEYDIALLGCGAYGLPLAAQIKRQGKQAIHIGGGLQLLFGIRGRRWDEMDNFKGFFNEAWVYPDNRERPKNAGEVENACYW